MGRAWEEVKGVKKVQGLKEGKGNEKGGTSIWALRARSSFSLSRRCSFSFVYFASETIFSLTPRAPLKKRHSKNNVFVLIQIASVNMTTGSNVKKKSYLMMI